MNWRIHLRNWGRNVSGFRDDERGSQIVEFALSLPLLILFVIGIFDFSTAVSLKQKLTNAAREAARVAAADPANDLSGSMLPMPVSVRDALQVADSYLVSERLNDCALTGASPTPGADLTWSFNAQNNGCGSPGVTLTINRGYYFPLTGTATPSSNCASSQTTTSQTAAIGTCVILQYPYKWQFGGVSGLFGGSFLGPTVITATAVAFNEN